MRITFEFATQDDCLDKMVPSDLRTLVRERDDAEADNTALRAEVEELRAVHHAELGVCEKHCDVVKRLRLLCECGALAMAEMEHPNHKLYDALEAAGRRRARGGAGQCLTQS